MAGGWGARRQAASHAVNDHNGRLTMNVSRLTAVAAVLAAVGGTGAAAAVAAQPATTTAPASASLTRQYEGTVLSVDRSARTFRLRDSERGTITVKVTARTSYERVRGLRGLRAGMTRIEADVRRSNGRWVATHVERSGGGGQHGGGDDDRGGSGRDHAEDD
jgi:hypothetical protein